MNRINLFSYVIIFATILVCSCNHNRQSGRFANTRPTAIADVLNDSLKIITQQYPATIGAAVIHKGDTVTVNNDDNYPLMSVFKLHQAIALCHLLDNNGTSIDTVINIERRKLDPDTWSPMLKEHTEELLKLPLSELLRYTLIQSDNNASNVMFDRLQPVCNADSFIASLIPRECFQLSTTEREIKENHNMASENHSSPLGVALLIERLVCDSIISREKQDFILKALRECKTGTDRIMAPLAGKANVEVYHKTGSGYRSEEGVLVAHNDAACVCLPDGSHYILVVLVKDFAGTEEEASAAIARISSAVYSIITNDNL